MKPDTTTFAEATALPSALRSSLEDLGVSTMREAARRASVDGTVKLLLEARDGLYIETVVMPYQRRTTACVSSQAGCPVGCSFCATGAAGFKRNLAPAEIVDQVRAARAVFAQSGERLSNVVFMGMGEPLLNLQAVLSSIRILTHPLGLNLGNRSISVSTVGIPAGILRMARAAPQVNLAVSLHAPSDSLRALLIPDCHRHPLTDILGAAWDHFALTRRKLMIEYVLLRGVNDSVEDALRLAGLLRGHVVTVNLLTLNPGREVKQQRAPRSRRPVFEPSTPAAVSAFRDTLLGRHIEVTTRQSKGVDIEAACGQLAGEYPARAD